MFKKLFVLFIFIWPVCYAKIMPDYNKREKYLTWGGYLPENETLSKYAVSVAYLDWFDVNDEKDMGEGHVCTGIIIGLRTILAAAHCLYHYEAKKLVVVAGSPQLKKKTASTQTVGVKNAIIHPDVRRGDKKSPHDIGIIHLSKSLIVYPGSVEIYHEFICVGHKEGEICQLIDYGSSGPSSLQQIYYIDFSVRRKKICDKIFMPVEKTFCGVTDGNQSCVCTTGGPVFCDGMLNGIAYYTLSCYSTYGGNPTFFVDICKYDDWIQKNSLDFIFYKSSSRRKLHDNIYLKILSIILFCKYVLY